MNLNRVMIIATFVGMFLIYSTGMVKAQTDNYPGYALDFNYDFIQCSTPESLRNFNAMTLEAWVCIEDETNDQKVMGCYQDENNYFVLGITDNYLHAEIKINGNHINTNNGSIPYNKWNHIAFTFEKGNGGNNGICRGYVNGEIVYVKTDVAPDPISITTTNGFIIGAEPWGGSNLFPVFGKLDELRVWNVARSIEEIRENIYHTLSGSETGLVSYWQCNEGAGEWIYDRISSNNGWLEYLDKISWVNSTIPVGNCGVDSQIVNSTGNVTFSGTGVEMDITSKTGTDTIVVSRVDTMPNLFPVGVETNFNRQYWIINKFGDGSFVGDISFTVSETLNASDETYPHLLKLYKRAVNSDTAWIYVEHATTVSSVNKTITFEGISDTGQYFIVRNPSDQFPGNSVYVNAYDDWLNCWHDVSLQIGGTDAQITLEAWINPDSFYSDSLGNLIVHKASNRGTTPNGYKFCCGKNGILSLQLGGTDGAWHEIQSPESTVRTGVWQHVAGTYDGSAIRLFINGEICATLPGVFTISPNQNEYFTIGSGSGAQQYSSFKGKLDEIRLWNVARTADEIRENIFIALSGKESGIVSYWQCNEGNGDVFYDMIGPNNGVFFEIAANNRQASSIPFGGGKSNAEIVNTTGLVDFTNTGVEMDFTAKSGIDTICLSRIDTVPNILPTEIDTTFSQQYWVVDKFGSGSFSTNITLTVDEDIIAADEDIAANFKLFTRGSTTDTSWVYLTNATSVNAANNTLTFPGITDFSQFIICKTNPHIYRGTALELDEEYIDCGKHSLLGNFDAMTLEVWVWLDDATGNQKIMGNLQDWDNYFVLGVSLGKLYMEMKANGALISTSNGIINSQEWNHLAFTFEKGDGGNNGTALGYINGEIVYKKTDVAPYSLEIESLKGFIIGAEPWGFSDIYPLDGKIDEIRVWDVARSTDEIRANMYLPLTGGEPGLVSYWQFNKGTGDSILDKIHYYYGALESISPAQWVSSSIPFGNGFSDNTIVSSTGDVSFTGTGLSMNFTAKTGSDSIVVTRIDTVPNMILSGPNTSLDNQYWIVNSFGQGSFTTDLSMSVSEELTSNDYLFPSDIRLYRRNSNSDTTWAFLNNATSVDTQNNVATFKSVDNFSQFLITRNAFDHIPGDALSFDGVSDSVVLENENHFDFDHEFTIEMWLKVEEMSDGQHLILSKGSAWWLKIFYSSGIVLFEFAIDNTRIAQYEISTSVILNQWCHLACVYSDIPSNETVKIYLNGEEGSYVSSEPLIANNLQVCIGNEFKGLLDEIRIWDTTRTISEIREFMHNTLSRDEEGLVSYLQFNECSGTQANDLVGENNGTLHNMNDANWVSSDALWKRWEGTAKSSDWSSPGNWSTTFSPPSTNDMISISNTTTQAHITSTPENPSVCNQLKIESGAALTIDAGKALSVSAKIENEAGNAGLVLKSDSEGTASFIHVQDGVNATVERYIPQYTGDEGWHNLSSPVAAQAIRPNFVPNENPIPGSNDFYKFDEPTDYWINTKDNSGNWNSAFEDNFAIGQGYNVAYNENVTKSFSGELNTGDFTFDGSSTPAITYSVSGAEGWNLMGNPYSSAIDWDDCRKSNINGSVYVFNGEAGQYISWNGSIGSLTNGIIPPMNGFFIKVSTGASLTVSNSARLHTTTNFYKEKDYIKDLLVLKVEGNGFSDKTYIHFNGEASNNFDSEFDAYKLFGIYKAPQIYTLSGETRLSINVQPYSYNEIIIPLGLKVGEETEYKLSVTENSFWETMEVSLKDLETGNLYNLGTQNSIDFIQSPGISEGRFLLIINGATGLEENTNENEIRIYTYGDKIIVNSDGMGAKQISVYNLIGQLVLTRMLTGYEIISGFKTGFYIVAVETDMTFKTRKVFIR